MAILLPLVAFTLARLQVNRWLWLDAASLVAPATRSTAVRQLDDACWTHAGALHEAAAGGAGPQPRVVVRRDGLRRRAVTTVIPQRGAARGRHISLRAERLARTLSSEEPVFLAAASATSLPRVARPREQRALNPVLAARIRQLTERTRICSREVWEEVYLPQLRGECGAALMKSAMTQCCVCVSDISRHDQIRGLACGHIYHLNCVAEWFMRDPTFELSCPLCRIPMSEQRRFEDAAPAAEA